MQITWHPDATDGPIHVHGPTGYQPYTPNNWVAALEDVLQGRLPVGATEAGNPPNHVGATIWAGGAVVWDGQPYPAMEWREFVEKVLAGQLSVEILTGAPGAG